MTYLLVGMIIYIIIACVTMSLFHETMIKHYYTYQKDKMKDWIKVVFYSMLWPIFLTVMLLAIKNWRK